MTTEEQYVCTVMKNEAGCFDERAILGVAVEDLDGIAGGSYAVGFHFLEHDRGGMGAVAVAADAAAAEGTAIDFVDDVERAIAVGEASRVNSAALARGWIQHWFVKD